MPAGIVIADTAYDSGVLRRIIAEKAALAVIPNNPSRALKYPLDRELYAWRRLIEFLFSRLKWFLKVAARCEKTAGNHLTVITIDAITRWSGWAPTQPTARTPPNRAARSPAAGP